MSLPPFASSRPFTMGVELELQVVNRRDYDLTPGGLDLIRLVEPRLRRARLAADLKPEITQSMVETATGVCTAHDEVVDQLGAVRDLLVEAAGRLDLRVAGGGTHPFQDWSRRRIVDTPRYRQVSQLYGYLTRQFTVFGQHVHLGCPSADEALWLLHALARFVPHAIALAASSPFVQGHDSGFQSARLNTVAMFPLSGRAPWVLRWTDFEAYFDKMRRTGVVASMKDFYWDIRPKPEFGTIEVRVMDTPLTIGRAAAIAAYLQAVSRWLLLERPIQPSEDDALVYAYNRFQACRFGLDGEVVEPGGEHRPLRGLVLQTLDRIEAHAIDLRGDDGLRRLRAEVARGTPGDADWLRARQAHEDFLPEVVRQACRRFEGEAA